MATAATKRALTLTCASAAHPDLPARAFDASKARTCPGGSLNVPPGPFPFGVPMTDLAPLNTAEPTALVPLADCYVHALNTRSEPPSEEIEALAASIDEIGLLQNLSGWLDPDQPSKVGVVAGGRRLRAMILLAQRQERSLDDTRVPVKIAPDEDTARTWASAENSARAALHPADEIRAYGRLQAKGADPNAIARAFAVSERHVRQRLKLATLPASVLDALRCGKISLEQTAAFTAGTSEEAIEAELKRVLNGDRWNTGSNHIHHNLTQTMVSATDKRARFIGVEAYRAAGGRVQEDLFTDHVGLLDEAILDRMVRSRLSDLVDTYLSQGWKWAEIIKAEECYDAGDNMDRVLRVPVELPEADAAELVALQKRGQEEELSKADFARMTELEERKLGDYSDEDRATSGVFLFLDHSGEIDMVGPYRRREDDPARDPDAGKDATGGEVETKAPPQNLIDDLSMIRLAALQQRAAAQTELMLDLLAWQLSGGMRPYERVLAFSAERQPLAPSKAEGFELPASLVDPDPGKEHATSERFAEFRALGKKHRNEVLSRALARTLMPHRDMAPFLAELLAPDPRQIWTPTAAAYLGRLPVPSIDRLWAELVPEDRREGIEFDGKKKGEKAKILERLFNEADFREALGLSRDMNARIDAWLPQQLQWPAPEAEA
ncbi:ParB N-terminal domain-containing protein [Cereibacter sphaeroides]|nr:ParB N-terminal domain-containing protein [Cereibacter sphaeroides]